MREIYSHYTTEITFADLSLSSIFQTQLSASKF